MGWGISNDYAIKDPGNYNQLTHKTNMPLASQTAILHFIAVLSFKANLPN